MAEPLANDAPATGRSTGVELTAEQRAIVEWGDGPLVVIAGAGTGKTRVIVERVDSVRHLLETQGEQAWTAAGQPIPAEPGRHDNPFEGPLAPEQILVLTYNVKAARELPERLEKALGPATRARLTVVELARVGRLLHRGGGW
jgi:ATP-dependent exoDNAse (exonuclease V) beta subunit